MDKSICKKCVHCVEITIVGGWIYRCEKFDSMAKYIDAVKSCSRFNEK